jgi:para-nitrobenzyl esterase
MRPNDPTDTTTRPFDTPVGRIEALVDGDVVRALGIPYARAERFRPPVPVPPFDDVFRATTPSPAAPQRTSPVVDLLLQGSEDGMVSSEDCQNLSVTVPADVGPDERLPVMVWIHGGSYVLGAGDMPIHDPHDLVAEQRVVVVTVTYRLGLLGFLGDGERVPANLGLLDMITALRWVHENVAAFGGDPDAVTLFGQSAGGDAVAHLMIAEGTAGLFRRAVVQSAPFGIMRGRARMNAVMSRAVGIVPPDADRDELLRLESRAERAAVRFGLNGAMPFGPQYGYPPLPAERDLDAAWRAVAADVDVLVGSASDETGLYVAVLPGLRRTTRRRPVRALVRWLVVRPSTTRIYRRGVERFARRHRDAGGRATRYTLLRGASGRRSGAVHMSDVPLLLGTEAAWARTAFVGPRGLDDRRRRGRELRAAWAEFARTGTVTAPDSDTLRFDR